MSERVLHIVGSMGRAGAETMIMNIYREIDKSIYQFDFLFFTDSKSDYDDEIEMLGGRIYRIPEKGIFQRFFKLMKILRDNKWGIVHSHMLFGSGLHLLAAKIAGVSIRVAHSHNTEDVNSNSFVRWLYQCLMRRMIKISANRLAACGTAASDFLFRESSVVKIIPNSINIDSFTLADRMKFRNEIGLVEGQVLVVHIARMMPVKNHLWTIKVAKQLKETGFNFRLVLVGDGDKRQEINDDIESCGLSSEVLLMGVRDDIPDIMAAADAMIMPSLYEGFPVVLVESQAAGLCSVISNTISSEVDLGLNLVRFAGLTESASHWANLIVEASKAPRPSVAERLDLLALSGFSSKSGVVMINELYKKV